MVNRTLLTILASAFVGVFTPLAAPSAGEVVVITSFPKELYETYKQAFEARHPGIRIVVKSKSTSAAVSYVQETRTRPDADLIWVSAADAFAVLKGDSLLAPHRLPADIASRIPERIGPYPIHDPDGAFFGFALSGYGIMWNKPYLQAYGLQEPKEWADLTAPSYHSHLAISAPSRSGTTHLLIESILQAGGWEKGWEQVMTIAGNMATITERSFGVPQGVNNGEFGIGLVIDFFGLSAIASGYPVGFAYPSNTPIIPAGIGLIAGGPNPEEAAGFVHFLLSDEGQKLLFAPQISRLPVIPGLYAKAPEGFPNPFDMAEKVAEFDIETSEQRYGMVNALFDQIITFRMSELKQAWGEIHRAEAALRKAVSGGKSVGHAAALLADARELVTAVPVSAQQAADSGFCAGFSGESNEEQTRLETEWDSRSRKHYTTARKLALQAADALE